MSGIAEVLLNLGYQVSGSDLHRSAVTDRLQGLGIRFDEGHDSRHIGDADLVVVSTAVPSDNPERLAAERTGIRVVSRGEMLAALTDLKRGVAVAGSHGKTTTTAMVALVLEAAGLDPTAIIGGKLSAFGSNARLGHGSFIVVEADESDRSFLRLSPEIAVATNLDDEHLDAYDGIEGLEDAFVAFTERVSPTGCVIVCIDDPRLRRLLPRIRREVLTYGIDDPSADVSVREMRLESTGSVSQLRIPGSTMHHELSLSVPGRHNVLNALASTAVGLRLGISAGTISGALANFRGADRRLQDYGEVGGVGVVDDYGHHPTEIAAVIDAVRLRAPRRLRVVFQPHRYSRTIRLLERFGVVLSTADEVWLTEVYAAGEAPISGATSEAIAEAVRRVSSTPVRVVTDLDQIPGAIAADARAGDVIVTFGAGSIGRVPGSIIEALRHRARSGC